MRSTRPHSGVLHDPGGSSVFAANAAGTTDYLDGSVVPHLTDSQAATCISPADQAHFQATGEAVLDGSSNACRPGSDPDAVEPGIFGPAQLPHLTRNDYVANSNDAPWLINSNQPLTSYPRIVGRAPGTPQSLHQRQAIQMINARLTGVDGLGPAGFTPSTLADLALGAGDYAGQLLRDDVVHLCRTRPSLPDSAGHPVDVRLACDVLANWDLHANVNSRGEVLFREFTHGLARGVPWQVPFDPNQPLTTPTGVNTTPPQVSTALADAVDTMTAHHLPLDTSLGAVQHLTTPSGPVPVHGCVNCYDNVASSAGTELTPAGVYPDVDGGASFLMISSITAQGARSQTILVYGESENLISPHHWDQISLFSTKHWITDRFTDTEISTDPALTTTHLHVPKP